MTLFPVAILAGGRATRLGPLCDDLPKALLPMAGKPFIDHQLVRLAKQGVTRVILCVGYLAERIIEFVGDGAAWGLKVSYVHDGEKPRGTGGAIAQVFVSYPEVRKGLFVLYGDSYLTVSFADVQKHFQMQTSEGLMTVFHNDGRWDVSNIHYQDGVVHAYDKVHRTPQMRHIDYGLGILTYEAFRDREATQVCDLSLVYQDVLARGRLTAYEVKERFYEVGSVTGIHETEQFLTGEGA